MRLKLLKQQWGDVSFENKISRITLPLVVAALLIAVFALANDDPVVVIQPPGLTEETEIAKTQADAGFKQAYGLYVASMLGNVHPGNAEFLVGALEAMIHPRIYHDVKEDVMSQVTEIIDEDIAISFDPRDSDYWSDTNRVVVYGNREMSGRGTDTVIDRITYEIEVEIRNYRPMITFIDTYDGSPERRR